MTEQEKLLIAEYKHNGMSSNDIAELLGVSVGSVKSFCSTNSITEGYEFCKECGKPIEDEKQSKYCSPECRNTWWRKHKSVIYKGRYKFVCTYCGKDFTRSHGNEHQKYCSHECYIKDRFGGKKNE